MRSFLRCGVVHGAGRISDIEDLRLEKAEVKIGKGAIAVDKYMRTSNPRIYAAGDCVSEGVKLTPGEGINIFAAVMRLGLKVYGHKNWFLPVLLHVRIFHICCKYSRKTSISTQIII